MRARSFAACAAALAASLLACEWVADIRDHDFVVDGGMPALDDGGADAPSSTDLCPHENPPPRPTEASSGPASGSDFAVTLAMRSFDFGISADAGAVGFDLDGICTCDPRDGRHAPAICVTPAHDVGAGCDLDGGIDNEVARVLPSFVSDAPLAAIRCGRLDVLFALEGYNGRADDPQVSFSATPSYGIRDPGDGGAAQAACGVNDHPPRWDGHDRWSVPTNAVAFGKPTAEPADGWVRDHRLVVDGRAGGRAMNMVFGATVIKLLSPVVVARLVPIDASGADVPLATGEPTQTPASYRLADGVIAGRVAADDLLSVMGSFKLTTATDSNYLCADPLYVALKDKLCNAVDMTSALTTQSVNAPCDALSIALRFEAAPAQFGDAYDPPAPPPGCGPGFRDTCAQP